MASSRSLASMENAGCLPSPPASTATPSQHGSPLPQPRRKPLKPGSVKESELIRYLDHSMNRVQKRVDDRVTSWKVKPQPGVGEESGYSAFWEVADDLDGLVDVVWVSGSPNLQVPYLLNIAVLAVEYLPLFDPSTRSVRASLRLLSKLDYVFSSLLTGHNSTNGESLPGFELGRCVSTTDKVRLKGIVDRTRLIVVRVMSEERADGDESGVGEPVDEDGEGEDAVAAGAPESTVSFEGFENTADDSAEDDDWEGHEVASVYEKTIGQLGDVLGGPPIGIITEDWDAIGTESQRDVQGFGAKE